MRVLIACEFSGTVRRAFRALGHDAWSCDLLPDEHESPYHWRCDVRTRMYCRGWDLMPVSIISSRIRKPDQIIQPWQFGHGETKATCLWLKNLPKLVPTNIVDGRHPKVHRMPPGPDRWKERSRTYQGIADAMAAQWGGSAQERAA